MAKPNETEIRHLLAVLEGAMHRCRNILKMQQPEEADIREGLCYLKLAHADAEYGLTGVERGEWHVLQAEAVGMVSQLLGPLRGFNPELSNWERARDPGIPVQGGRLRSGGRRPFDPQRVKAAYDAEKARLRSAAPPIHSPPPSRPNKGNPAPPPRPTSILPAGSIQAEYSVPSGVATPPGEPPAPPPGMGANEGPMGGRFEMGTTEGETSYDETERRVQRRGRRSTKNRKKYGHQIDDLDFFRGTYQEELEALQCLDLGDDFRYPSDRAFSLYFPEFDFVKAMRSNSLRKWDGSIRDYPNFKHTYYRMVFVQREHYMHKILALEQMVPDTIKTELFHGLHHTVSDLGQRLRRLEDRFGGQEKQLKQIVNDLQKLGGKGKVPYPELRRAVEDVDAHLSRPGTLPGEGETLVVLLKKLVPRHFRTQFSDTMHQWGRPRTGNNFVAYLKRRLNYELDEIEDGGTAAPPRKEEEVKDKKTATKTLGKLYNAVAVTSSKESDGPSDLSSGDEGDCRITGGQQRPLPQCKCCDQGRHQLHSCRTFFMVYSLKDRVSFATQQKICKKCLRYDHTMDKCPFKLKPDCRFCSSSEHHYLLCPGPVEGAVKVSEGSEGVVEGYGLENIGELIARRNVSTMQLVAHIEGANGKFIPVNILPDTGASHNILDKAAADRAGLTGFQCKYRVTAHGGHVTEHEAVCGEMTLVNPRQPGEKHKVRFYSYANPCGPFFPTDWSKMKGGWPHLKSLDIPAPVAGQPVELILGCENLRLFEGVKPSSIKGPTDPVARLTCLGWMIGGRTHPEASTDVEGDSRCVDGDIGIASGKDLRKVRDIKMREESCAINQVNSVAGNLEVVGRTPATGEEFDELRRNLHRVWELETEEETRKLTNSYYPPIRSARDKRAEAMLTDNLHRLDNGQYQTRLLWSTDRRPHNNYDEAKRAFIHWERRLASDTRLRKAFHAAMDNWIQCQYLENIDNIADSSQNFLTTFMVLKGSGENTKARLVVNGARKFKGECLNDFLETGGNVMIDLTELLLKLRQAKYVVSCDLKDMFLNIKVSPEDRQYLRVFYRKSPEDELQVYQFTVHAFGLSSSPCVAMTAVQAHAKRYGDRWPLAELAIRKHSLVDDIWLLSDNRSELVQGMSEVQELMGQIGISVHKWGSNCPELLKNIPDEKRARQVELSDCDGVAIKALGIVWDTERDVFRFPDGPPDLQPWTLRRMASAAGQLFDPLVLLGPTSLPAKLLVQHAWRYQDSWDTELPECLGKKMSLYCKNQKQLTKIGIKRYVGNQAGKLVVFTDASTMAQAAAAYWVSEESGKIESRLIASKTKVTGLRQHEHIGRLELVAAVIGVALALKIAVAYSFPMEEVTYFTDSMSVLYWLSTTAPLSAYAGHRVAKIGERSNFGQWNYVSTKDNPSDLPTRGVRAEELVNCELWWCGPSFLRKPRPEWPEQPYIRATEAAAAETRTVQEISKNIILLSKSPSPHEEREAARLDLFKRVMEQGHSARKTMRLLSRLNEVMHCRYNNNKFDMIFSRWEALWMKTEQQRVFKKLYSELTQNQRPSEMLEMKPCLDSKGLIRVATGLDHSLHHDWETTFPILLHHKMGFVRELLEYLHKQGLAHQGGVSTLLGFSRKRFYIVGGKRLATSVVQNCFTCAKKHWKPIQRSMPEFHESRMGNHSLMAFNEIGIDHAGPFQLRQGRSTVEGYVLVIACCATRAVNLEMSLSTGADHVLAALQRHIGVFGSPKCINSDMAPGYVKARRVMKDRAEQYTTEGWDYVKCPRWHINVPYSPTWSGHVESMVKITKEALRNLHSGPSMTKLTPDEFYTQLKRAQGYINMRPLIQTTADQVPLTPGEFMGTGNNWLTSFVFTPEEKGASGFRFRQMEEIRKNIWARFRTDYLMWLRRQGGGELHHPQVGDLVLVQDVPSWKGDGWPVGRIKSLKSPRVFEIEIIPTEELKKEPQMIKGKERLKLKKKTIERNYRKVGFLPRIN